jgi:predicted kinase
LPNQNVTVVLLVGLPGSGKSTYAANCSAATGAAVLSSDEIRRLLSDDPANQTIHKRVFAMKRSLLRHRLQLKRPVTYLDATHLTRSERRPYLKLAALYDATIEAVFFDVPLDECQRRNRNRDRVVPELVIERMAKRLEPPSIEEGFARVIVVR